MWLFITFTQAQSVLTSLLLWWFFKPQRQSSKLLLVLSVFIINNALLIYGLSEFWGERFNVYLVAGILQGFMLYAALITAVLALVFSRVLKQYSRPKLIRLFAVFTYIGIVGLSVFKAYQFRCILFTLD